MDSRTSIFTIQTGFCGLWGARVDAIDYYTSEIQKLSEQELAERERVECDPKAVLPAAFVSFRSRWGAAVCAQTQQSSDPTIWLTEWAPEPTDVYWANLAIPYVELSIRRLLMAVAFFFLVFFFMVPIAFVQSVANIDGIQRAFPFLKSMIQKLMLSHLMHPWIVLDADYTCLSHFVFVLKRGSSELG
ncbi:CSC1-like protein [Drosera capensis]